MSFLISMTIKKIQANEERTRLQLKYFKMISIRFLYTRDIV